MMTAHNELNGIPCHSNRWLMEDVVRGEWGFEGFIVSDWMDVEHIHDLHRTATDNKDAFRQSVNAGMDMHMHGLQFYEKVIELVKEGAVSESAVNRACLKILTAKFKLGLFENPYTDTEQTSKSVFTEKHRATAYEAAVKSVVLLTNDGILPLDASKSMRVLVTGTNADNQTILGDWALPQPEENVTTILEGLEEQSPASKFTFIDQGWNIRRMSRSKVDEAVSAARKSDLAIVVIGEHSLRNNWGDKTCGEDCDRSDIALAGLSQQLAQHIIETGTPIIVVLINGRQPVSYTHLTLPTTLGV